MAQSTARRTGWRVPALTGLLAAAAISAVCTEESAPDARPDAWLTGDFAAGDVRNGVSGDSVVVTVTYSYSVITPVPRFIGLGSSLDLTSMTEMRYE